MTVLGQQAHDKNLAAMDAAKFASQQEEIGKREQGNERLKAQLNPPKAQIVSVVDPTTGKGKFVTADEALAGAMQPYERAEKPGAPVVVKDPRTGKDRLMDAQRAASLGLEPGTKAGADAS